MTIEGTIYAALKEHKDGRRAIEELMAIPVASKRAKVNQGVETARSERQLKMDA